MDMVVDKKSVEGWFSMMREGLITLPQFQRFEAWKPSQIEGVLENMLRDPQLPIGSLLTLEVGDEELFVSRTVAGEPASSSKPKVNLLDGQQRVTAIWKALNDKYEEFSVFVGLENVDKPAVDIVRKPINRKTNERQLPKKFRDPASTLSDQRVPAKVLLPGHGGEKYKDRWISLATNDNLDKFKEVSNQISNLRNRVAKYHIPYIQLPVSIDKETALDIFINMNVSASPLKDFDIVVAQLESATSKSLHGMITELKESVPEIKDFGNPEDIALSVGALLNGKAPLKSTYLEKSFGEELDSVWDKVVSGIKRGVEFLQNDEMIFNEKLLPTEIITYLTSALWANLPEFGTDQEGVARRLIRKAVWRASFTDRYTKTATTRAYADYKSLKKLLVNPSCIELPPLFNDELHPLPNEADLRGAGWPSRRDRIGRAILVASLLDGGLDFASDEKASSGNVRKREYHHIFPQALIEDKFSSNIVHSALNCALISWKTNRKISAKSPKEYIEERATEVKTSMKQVQKRLESHLIPYETLIEGDFESFLDARAKLMHARMEELCEGNR